MRTAVRLVSVLALAGALVATTQVSSLAAAHERAMGMAPIGAQKAQVTILSPTEGATLPGAGWDLQVQVVVPAADRTVVAATPALVGPTSPYFKPGPNHAFPGLVVTDTGTNAKLGGPDENLAGLFQIVGVETDFQGDSVIEADWLVGKPLFGSVPMPCIRAYVVSGTAPAQVATAPTNRDIGAKVGVSTLLSNVAQVDVATGGTAAAAGM